jgi:hypothetical protein
MFSSIPSQVSAYKALFSCFTLSEERMWCPEGQRKLMADYSHILFNKSPLQVRLLGARGGKAFGRNERLRRALLPPPTPASVSLPAVPRHTTAEAVAALDARFPWLRGAEKRARHAPPSRSGHR